MEGEGASRGTPGRGRYARLTEFLKSLRLSTQTDRCKDNFDDVNRALSHVSDWFTVNNLLLNAKKNKCLEFVLPNVKNVHSLTSACWNGSPVLVSAALVDPQRGGQTTLSASQVAVGSKRLRIVELGTPYKRPMSSSGRLSVDVMMMMMNVKKNYKNILINGETSQIENSTVFLGVTLDCKLKWGTHIESLVSKLSSAAYAIRKIRQLTDVEKARLVYFILLHTFAVL
ncbi:jg20124 [Pararge aegeria aegeria]|uniref:Jg20124 protein n=1 Tax=Pararge aegeria aegeria TaxID=348720 RepID=A0A8S4R8Y3_9NEOP|nr:jg20124 [Pararge aegeria aegeria]